MIGSCSFQEEGERPVAWLELKQKGVDGPAWNSIDRHSFFTSIEQQWTGFWEVAYERLQ